MNVRVTLSEASTLFGLPPPLRGRVGERGKPRTRTEDMRRRFTNEPVEIISNEAIFLTMRREIEQAAPLSLTLPRKGGGNPSAGASLTPIAESGLPA